MTESSSQLSSKELIAALMVIVLWGVNFVPMKLALIDFTPFQLGAARFLLAAFPLVFLVPRPKAPAKWLLLYGLTQGIGQFGFLFFALQQGMSAALASVLMQTQIFFTALMGAAFIGEIIPRALKAGMVVAAAGLVCFAINVFSEEGAGAVTAAGLGLTLIAASMWACANITVKKIQSYGQGDSPLTLVAWSSVVAAAGFVSLSLLYDQPSAHQNWLDASVTSWLSLLYLGWIASGFAYWLWTLLLTRHPASRVAPFSLGVPVVGLITGILALGERVSPLQWVGSALVMSALIVVVVGLTYSARRMAKRYPALE
ncbi:EamA family transporter [Pseudomaricurvus sp.]|uniref:EamA family transporter n=1 Tax=Pseudomaricurvus sp. TaxID=2004510 RepID=UPI003F6C1854